jgi:hypothetical protein
MPFLGIGLHVLVAIFFAIHVVRNRREMYWLMILFMFPLLGSVVYFFAVYLPDSRLHHGVRKAGMVALKSLDPGRELREAQQAFEMTPSAQNQMRLAAACLDSGDFSQAAAHYEACLHGPFSNNSEILFGAARARLHNGQAAAALELLNKIRTGDREFRKEAVGLLFALCYAAQANVEQARAEFESVVQQFGSVEAYVEYAIWALSIGDVACAQTQKTELEKMQKHWGSQHFSMHREILKRLDYAFAKAPKV